MQIKETTIGLIVLIVLFLVLLLGGSKLPPEIAQYRTTGLLIILALIVLWFVFFVVKKVLAVRSAMAIEKKLKAQASEQVAGARPDKAPELQALATGMDEAIAALKTSKLGASALYALPWYIIIGPPGTGKTTALQESGLNFPYTSKGKGKIQGVGGTRNCDWWFTDQGILLDTAGRYTTELEDRDEWLGFLDMLKKCRQERPINGAIICMAVNEILQSTDEQLEEYAKKIRDRIDELTKRLEIVFPIYLLFTKCDLLNGFTDFFEDFTKADRSQVWGVTMPYQTQGTTNLQNLFEEECKKFYERLVLHRLNALAIDRKIEKKRNIYSFPIEFSMAHKRMADFIGLLFRPNPYQDSAILRGFYFTSGTQEGLPIDQIVAAIGASIPGLKDVSASFSGANVDKKSYFINQLFTKIIFGDQNLARLSFRVMRMRRLAGLATVGFSILGFIGITLLLVFSFVYNQAKLRFVGSAGDKVKTAAAKPEDIEANLKAVDKLRGEIADLEDGATVWRRFGLNRDSTVLEPAKRLYFQQIQRMFLDPLKRVLEKELTDRKQAKSETVLQELSDLFLAYRILAGVITPIPSDPELHHRILKDPKNSPSKDDRNLWIYAASPEGNLSDDLKRLAARQLDFHLSHFKEAPRIANPDSNLMAEIEKWLKEGFWIEAMYRKIKQNALDNMQAEFPEIGNNLLGTARGREYLKMNHSVPGIFCQTGYNGYVRNQILQKSRDLAKTYDVLKIEMTADQIADRLLTAYKDEYAQHWDKYLDSIELGDFVDADDAVKQLKVLSGKGDAAYSKLFEKVWEMRVLRIDGKPHFEYSDKGAWVPDALSALLKLLNGIQEFASGGSRGERLRVNLDQDPQLKSLMKAFRDTKEALTNAMSGVDQAVVSRVERIFTAPIDRTREALRREARDEINKLWNEQARPLYEQHLKDRYPLNRDPKMKDIEMVQFATFFSPKSRYFTAIQDYAIQLSNIKIDQQPLLKFSDDFRRAMAVVSGYGDKEKASQSFHAVLWHASPEKPKGDDKITVAFTIKALPPIGSITQIQLKILKDPFDLSKWIEKNEPMRRTILWEQGTDVFMRISVGTNVAIPYEHKPGHHWGLFRLMDALRIDQKKPNEYALSYEYVTNTFVKFTLTCEDGNNPFPKDFFSRFKFPEKVAGD